MKTYTIKPLVWEPSEHHSICGEEQAKTPFNTYCVYRSTWSDPNQWWWDAYGSNAFKCSSLEDGKAQAEAHYLSRLTQALTPVESKESELREALDKAVDVLSDLEEEGRLSPEQIETLDALQAVNDSALARAALAETEVRDG